MAPKQVVWLGKPVRGRPEGDDKGYSYSHEYEIELTCDGRSLAKDRVASAGKQLMRWSVPQGVHFDEAREYKWSVRVCRSSAGAAEGVETSILGQTDSDSGTRKTKRRSAEGRFRIASSAPDCGALPPTERIGQLVDAGLPSDALLALLELVSRHQPCDAGVLEKLEQALTRDPTALSEGELKCVLVAAEGR